MQKLFTWMAHSRHHHRYLNPYVRRLHPNLHQLVKEIQKEQAMTQVTVQRATLGGAPPARRMKYVRIDEEVQRLTQRFDSDEITATNTEIIINDSLDHKHIS